MQSNIWTGEASGKVVQGYSAVTTEEMMLSLWGILTFLFFIQVLPVSLSLYFRIFRVFIEGFGLSGFLSHYKRMQNDGGAFTSKPKFSDTKKTIGRCSVGFFVLQTCSFCCGFRLASMLCLLGHVVRRTDFEQWRTVVTMGFDACHSEVSMYHPFLHDCPSFLCHCLLTLTR